MLKSKNVDMEKILGWNIKLALLLKHCYKLFTYGYLL